MKNGASVVAAPAPSFIFPNEDAITRSGIEPVIGHMKTNGHLGHCRLKGQEGDAANVILPAVDHNLRGVLAWLRCLLRLILLALWRESDGPLNGCRNGESQLTNLHGARLTYWLLS
jgi:hypothetical protein